MILDMVSEVEEKISRGRFMERRYVILGFSGWPDAGKAASLTVEYFIRSLNAEKVIELDYSTMHDLTISRPFVEIRNALIERLHMPRALFYYWADSNQNASLMIFSGPEPSFKWREFSDFVLKICNLISAKRVYLIGGVFD